MVVATGCWLWALWRGALFTVWSGSKVDGRVGRIMGDRGRRGSSAAAAWPIVSP